MAFIYNSQIILKVYLDSAEIRSAEVPITPDTTCGDVVACCREPGEANCHLVELWRGCERPVGDDECPYQILEQWGVHRDEVHFHLRHQPPPTAMDGRRLIRRNGIREEGDGQMLPSGVDLTLSELQEMASRQQQQIEAQQQMLVAKEQRLKFLKQQELRHQQIASENERLRKLREKVESQELKLKKLRALRGQVDQYKSGNSNLSAELETIKALFNEKEKELSVAVAKVEELTDQLEDQRKGRINGISGDNKLNSPAMIELEKLRKELLIRNKLNEQQNTKLSTHKELLLQRKTEMVDMDQRIAEIQVRLRKKRSQQQLQQENRNNLTNQNKMGNRGGRPGTANIAAVEPYIKHAPKEILLNDPPAQEKGFILSKQDPKYKTLPYNIKFPSTEGKTWEQETVTDKKPFENEKIKVDFGGKTNMPKISPDAPSPTGGKSQNRADYLPKDKVHKPPHFSPSLGHMTAYQAMEDTLIKSANGERPLQPPTKNIFGINYKPPTTLNNFVPRPFGTTYSTALLANRPSIITTQPEISPGFSTTTDLPGSFPKTSTPVANSNASNHPRDSAKEIFITGAPSVSQTNPYPSSYTPVSMPHGHSTIGPSQPNTVMTTSVGSIATAGYGGIPRSSVIQESKPGAPPLYHIASSRPQPSMQPQHTQAPQSPSSSTGSGPFSQQQQPIQSGQSRLPDQHTASSNIPSIAAPPAGRSNFQSNNLNSAGPNTFKQPLPVATNIKNSLSKQSNLHIGGPSLSTLPEGGILRGENSNQKSALDQDSKDAPQTAVSSAISVLMSSTATSSASGPRPTYRYAPKSVIANTYMKKLGSSTLDQYRKNMDKIYKDFNFPSSQAAASSGDAGDSREDHGGLSEGGHPPESPTAKVRPLNLAATAFKTDQKDGPPSPSKELQGSHPRLGSTEKDDNKSPDDQSKPANISGRLIPPYPGAPPYNIDPMRYNRPNAPKAIRRRLSSGDCDDSSHRLHQRAQRTNSEEEDETGFSSQGEALSGFNANGGPKSDIIRMDSIEDSYNNNDSEKFNNEQTYSTDHAGIKKTEKESNMPTVLRRRKGNLKSKDYVKSSRRVSFDPLALLLDASLEGELELVMRTAKEVPDPSAPNDEGITALHNAICAGHYEIVKFLVEFGCNVNAPDSDGWTPLHCAASCNNLPMVKFLVEHGACIFATTISDHETAAEKCEEDEDGYDGCSEFLYSVQEKLGIMNKGTVYAVFDYLAQNNDELTFKDGSSLTILRKGDENEKDWWWARYSDNEGYIPRNLLGLYPRVIPQFMQEVPAKARTSSDS